MITPKVNFQNLVCGLLPWYKRRPVRLSFLRALVAPLGRLFADFDVWRRETRWIINVNSQVGVLEGYLRMKHGQPIAIKIVTFDDGAIESCLEEEGENHIVYITLEQDDTPPTVIPLIGELRSEFGDADFIVYIPVGVDIGLIRADIEKYKQALTEYIIIQN